MLCTRLSLLAVLLHQCLLSIAAKDYVSCHHRRPSIETPSDCDAAIAMIPSGSLELDPNRPGDGDPLKPMDLHYPKGSRNRKYLLPAAFRAGSCMILVRGAQLPYSAWLRQRVGPPRPPRDAASAMYFTVWPKVKKLATEIVETCRRKGKHGNPPRVWGGAVSTSSQLLDHTGSDGSWKFRYTVTVRWAQSLRTADGVKVRIDPGSGVFNVYHAGGGATGGAAIKSAGVAAGVAVVDVTGSPAGGSTGGSAGGTGSRNSEG